MKTIHIKAFILAISMTASAAMQAQEHETLRLSNEQCRELAKATSRLMKIADNNAAKAKIDKKTAFSNFLPDVSGSFGIMYNFKDSELQPGVDLSLKGAYLAGISVSQPLYTGGKIRAGYKTAKLSEEMSRINERKTAADLVAEADEAYWIYVSVCQKVKMLEEYRKQLNELVRLATVGVDIQMQTRNDLLTVQAEQSQVEYNWQKAVNGRELARIALCQKIGVSRNTTIEATDTVIHVKTASTGLPDNDLSQRPELLLLEKQTQLKHQDVRMARAGYLPTISLSGGYSHYGGYKIGPERQNDGGFNLMAMASIPIYHFGENYKKVKRARLEAENSQLELEHNRELMELEVEQQQRNVSDASRMVQTAETALEQAGEALRLTQVSYKESLKTLTDLLAAQTRWQDAYGNVIEAKANYKIQETAYLKAIGRLQ